MKTVRNFLIDLIIALLISTPCFFLCDWMEQKGVFDWLDILIGLGSVSALLLVANILSARKCKKAKITAIFNTMTIIAFSATFIYGIFMLLEWCFPDNSEKGFVGNWVQWFPVSISLSVYLYLQERRRAQKYKNPNDLVVAAECREKAEAETICAMLEEKGIKAMVVEKGNPMFIDNNCTGVQVQVMGKEQQKAKQLIK